MLICENKSLFMEVHTRTHTRHFMCLFNVLLCNRIVSINFQCVWTIKFPFFSCFFFEGGCSPWCNPASDNQLADTRNCCAILHDRPPPIPPPSVQALHQHRQARPRPALAWKSLPRGGPGWLAVFTSTDAFKKYNCSCSKCRLGAGFARA